MPEQVPNVPSLPRFEVQRASPVHEHAANHENTPRENNTQGENDRHGSASMGSGGSPQQVTFTVEDDDAAMEEENHEEAKKNLYLYEEDMKQMPRVATFLKNFTSYHVTYPTEQEAAQAKKQPRKAKLGMMLGVYLPTIQHIFGVLMFVRLAWIVGCMGTLQAFAMVFLCCLTTFVTCISLSAIATNGVVQAGGSYYLISRTLGPECGGAVGICFYLANTFAIDLYALGSIEILLTYMAPSLSVFGDIHHNPWNNFRVYGTVLVVLLTLIVAVGVKFVQYFAPISLACVIVSITSICIGSFEASSTTRDSMICMLGERLLSPPDPHHSDYNGTMSDWCSLNSTGDLYHRYCHEENGTSVCDPYFLSSELSWRPGIPGMTSGIFKENLWSYFMDKGEVTPGVQGDSYRGEVINTMSTSFISLAAIYFPSVTGIMTGSNMSGDLKDPQKSIPIGSILAQLTTSIVYLAFVLFFGATGEGALLRDKFGQSQGGSLYASQIAWPNHWVVLVGAFCSTVGAALQCMTSAPRLLQAIARDNIIPFLDFFKVTTKNGEPLRALLLTAAIAEIGIIIASLDYVAPVIDVFFLMCYGFVNLTCALQTLMKTPSWRPRFKYYHWSLSFLGVILNLALSFTAGWYYALSAFAIAAFIYKYVEYKGGEKEWGDGITGLSMSAAQKALLKLEEEEPHTKNWRPQLLVLSKLDSESHIKYRQMFSFARQLKAGKGLTLVATVMEGNYLEMTDKYNAVKEEMKQCVEEEKVKGFVKVMVTKNIIEGLEIFIQTAGLGGMKPNTVMVGWPYEWKDHTEDKHWKVFLECIRTVTAREYALLVPRGIHNFPSRKDRLNGTIDVWWVVHDGGMLILLSFLLQQNKVWRGCKLRIFTVAQMTDNSIQLKKDLTEFLYQLRIEADVFVEEMYDSDISAYTVERTLDMEKRQKMLQDMKLKRRGTIQEIVDASHHPRSSGSETPPRTTSAAAAPVVTAPPPPPEKETLAQDSSASLGVPMADGVHFTFTPKSQEAKQLSQAVLKSDSSSSGEKEAELTESEGKLLRMHTAVKLNAAIRDKSKDAELVVLNFPAPPSNLSAEENYMEYLDALSEGIHRVLLVRGSGREVITIYS